jgi:hypothetical protein
MKRSVLVVTLGLLVFVAGSPLATGTPRPLPAVDSHVFGAVSDHWRYVSYKTGPEVVRVRDTKTGVAYDIGIGSTCSLADARSGIVLAVCGNGIHTYRLLFAATRSWLDVSAPATTFVTYDYIGRYWLQGTDCPGHCGTIYLNWRSGAQRHSSSQPRDIDTPNLVRYDWRRHDALIKGGPGRLNLYFRPSGLLSKRALIHRCEAYCDALPAFGGRAVWSEDSTIFGYIHRGRRHCSWRVRLPNGASPPTSMNLLPTRYAMAMTPLRGSGVTTLYLAPWRTC